MVVNTSFGKFFFAENVHISYTNSDLVVCFFGFGHFCKGNMALKIVCKQLWLYICFGKGTLAACFLVLVICCKLEM